MDPLVAPNCVRFSINGLYATRPVANIVDMTVIPQGGFASRPACIQDQAVILVQAWYDQIRPNLVSSYSAQSISWVDLNTLAGTTGESTTGITNNMPYSGSGAGDPMPGNVSYRVNKRVISQRGQRQGRMYLVGVSEADTAAGAPNTVSSAKVTAMNTRLSAFLAAVNQQADVNPLSYDSELVVIHTSSELNPNWPAESPKYLHTFEGASEVVTLTTDVTLASQRRRLRG